MGSCPQDYAENGRVQVGGASLLDRRPRFVDAIETYVHKTKAQIINGGRTQLNGLLSWCEPLIRSAKVLSIAINQSAQNQRIVWIGLILLLNQLKSLVEVARDVEFVVLGN